MKKKAIFHNILGAFSNFAFLFLTSIVLLPYYFRFVSAADYGIWLGGISFLSLVSVLEANISFILTRQLGEKWTNQEPLEFSKYLFAAFFAGLAASAIIVVSTWFFRDALAGWVSNREAGRELFSQSFFLYAISLACTITFGYLNCVTQVFLRTLMSPVFNLVGSAAGIIYTIVAVPTQGILAIAAGNLVKSVVYSVLVTVYVTLLLREKKIPFAFETRYLLLLLKNTGLPFISKVGMTLAVSIQNFIVATSISAGATTVFDITKKLPFMVQMLINMVTVSTFTSFSLFYAEQKSRENNHEYTKHYFALIRIILLIPLVIVFLAGQDFITLWVGSDKFGGNLLLALLCLTALTDQLRLMLSQQYYAIGRFNLTSLTDTVFAVSFMVFALILIPGMQLAGIVLAGILANLAYFIACSFMEKKRNVDMVSNIINRGFFFDLALVASVAAVAKLICTSFSGQMLAGAAVITTVTLLLGTLFYLKEKAMFDFMVFKFRKTS